MVETKLTSRCCFHLATIAFNAAENANIVAIRKLLVSSFTTILPYYHTTFHIGSLVTAVIVLGKNW